MGFDTLFIINFIENFCQLFIYSKLINKKDSYLSNDYSLPLISFLVYLTLVTGYFCSNYDFFFVYWKKLNKDCNINLIWFYSIFTIFSYVVFAYFMNATN